MEKKGRRGKERRREEEEEKRKKKKRRRGDQAKRYGTMVLSMELTLDMDHMNFVWNSRKVYEFQT